MPALVKYALLSAADLTIIGVLFHYLLSRLRWYTPIFTPPYQVNQFGRSNWRDLSYFDRLKRISYFAVVVVGIFICLHGAFDLLFSWMPHRWGEHTEDGEWVTYASGLSMLGAFFGGIALLYGLENTAEKVSELQLRQSKLEAIIVLLKSEVGHFKSILGYWRGLAAGHDEVMVRLIDGSAADHYARIEQEITEAYRIHGLGAVDDARICGDLVRIFRLAMKEEEHTR